MILDAQDMDRARVTGTRFDACVIGSGPAGMTVARMLAARGHRVALMEGGGLDFTEESQDLYVGTATGLDSVELDVSRLRFFGGSSNHWHGRTRPLEAIDFEPRPYAPLSGWPITKADLDPYQAGADDILDITSPVTPDMPVPGPEPAEGDPFRRITWRRSPPTRLAPKYQDEIAASETLTLVLNANLVDLRLNAALDSVTGAVFKSFQPGDPGFTIEAACYCLCLGGLENPRALLNFRSQIPEGIGNRTGLVGRHFHDHVAIEVADILLTEPLETNEVSYAPTKAFQDAHQSLNMAFMVTPRAPTDNSLVKQLIRTAECATPAIQRLVEEYRDTTLKCRAGGLTELWVQRDPDNHPSGFIWVASEQPLVAESRVFLNDETDAFGQNRITLDWRLDEAYYAHVREATIALGGVLAEQGVGRILVRNWLFDENPVLPRRAENVGEIDGLHHMGTTRMATDPARGVVDADCRVHGIDNLYIGGSSVFPTGGYANPTYTIVQMALRLADHLDRELRA